MSTTLRASLAAFLVASLSLPAFAEGDVAKGEKVFKKCLACHALAADAPAKAGPNLANIVGRQIASVEGFSYSPKMREIGAEGRVWSAEELDTFLENPKAMVPGTKMSFAGLKKPADREDLVAYLASLNTEPAAN